MLHALDLRRACLDCIAKQMAEVFDLFQDRGGQMGIRPLSEIVRDEKSADAGDAFLLQPQIHLPLSKFTGGRLFLTNGQDGDGGLVAQSAGSVAQAIHSLHESLGSRVEAAVGDGAAENKSVRIGELLRQQAAVVMNLALVTATACLTPPAWLDVEGTEPDKLIVQPAVIENLQHSQIERAVGKRRSADAQDLYCHNG